MGQPILKKLNGAISLKEAETYTNAGRVHTKLLYEHGFIHPVLGDAAKKLKTLLFAPADLDRFLESLLIDAQPVVEPPPAMMGIAKAAKHATAARRPSSVLFSTARLAKKARIIGELGYAALLVDLAEVRHHVRKPELDGLTLEAVMTELGTFHAVVRALVDNGKLPTYRASHPVNNQPLTLVSRAELDAFKKKYVSLAELAERGRKHPRAVRAALEQIGIVPAPELDKAIYRIIFYRRADVSS